MIFTSIDFVVVGLLLIIAAQTSYMTYRQWNNGTVRPSGVNPGILIDTSVLMDGRIVAIAETGFIPGKLVVPRSVVGELQFLADNADSDRRERARRGLDIVNQLQGMSGVDVEVLQDGSRTPNGVDERLLELAKEHGMKLCTIDFNLNKVAQVEDIVVLNVNELARNLRMSYLPGDVMSLDLTTKGSDSHQAVGHLGDGTMVVVEQAHKAIGTRQNVEVIRSLQTAAGKMLFARISQSTDQNAAKKNAMGHPKPSDSGRKKLATSNKKVDARQKTQPKSQKRISKRRSTTSQSSRTTPRNRIQSGENRLIDLVDAQDD